MQSLFKPFFTTKRHGQGLGLTLVKEILTQHGFAFSLEPAERGACFRIEIPIQAFRLTCAEVLFR
jgi:two-component system, NtrC family, nitrogen regulation sensor histidine kinase NtrY